MRPYFAKATKGILRFRELSNGLPFEASYSEAKNGGGFEEEMQEIAAFAEDTAEDFGDGEDELAVRDFVADGGGDPIGGLADAALVAGRAEVAAFAGEGEEALVAAIGAMEAEEAGGSRRRGRRSGGSCGRW